MKAKVYLVGAGPGAPGLITVRGKELLQTADLVIYDNLCNPYLLREAPKSARFIFAGKHSGISTISQAKIEKLMVQHALAGKTVIRLKGGDPFLFGRGGEEAQTLAKYKISYEIVPGVTSAIAVPAFAGIPVTHRDYASSVAIVTAYEDPTKTESIDYDVLAKFPGTLLFLMGVKRMAGIAERLVQAGKSKDTPAAMIRWGTRSIQKTITGKLGNISKIADRIGFRPPAVIVVGDVVKCRDQIKWFESKPLVGKRVVVTRTREQASELSAELLQRGADVIELPTIEIQRIKNRKVTGSIERISSYHWVFFTSPWGAKFFFDELMDVHGDIRVSRDLKFGAIGRVTAEKIRERGIPVSLVPKRRTSQGLIAELKKRAREFKGVKVLLPRSEIGRDDLELYLKSIGAHVDPISIYKNIAPKLTWELEALERAGADIVTFSSSSSVENYVKLVRSSKISKKLRSELKIARHISIGPETSKALKRYGMKVHAEASSSLPEMIKLIERL